jgi:hypothetical protein
MRLQRYRLVDHRRNGDAREELQSVVINSGIKDYEVKWLQYLGQMKQNRFSKLLSDHRPRSR